MDSEYEELRSLRRKPSISVEDDPEELLRINARLRVHLEHRIRMENEWKSEIRRMENRLKEREREVMEAVGVAALHEDIRGLKRENERLRGLFGTKEKERGPVEEEERNNLEIKELQRINDQLEEMINEKNWENEDLKKENEELKKKIQELENREMAQEGGRSINLSYSSTLISNISLCS